MQHRARKSKNDNTNIGTVDKTEWYWIPVCHLILVSMNMIIFCVLHTHKNKHDMSYDKALEKQFYLCSTGYANLTVILILAQVIKQNDIEFLAVTLYWFRGKKGSPPIFPWIWLSFAPSTNTRINNSVNSDKTKIHLQRLQQNWTWLDELW